MLPCQDTPAVKATYSATVSVAAPLTVVMSANDRRQLAADGAFHRFEFHQTTAIPVGTFACLDIYYSSPRCSRI